MARQAGPSARIGELMILIAAVAIGLALWRMTRWGIPLGLLRNIRPPGLSYATFLAAFHLAMTPMVTALTVAVAMIGGLRGRGQGRAMLARRGVLACVAASVSMLVLVAGGLVMTVAYPHLGFEGLLERREEVRGYLVMIGFAVFGAWVTARLVDGPATPAGRLDRLGRLLGWFWMLTPVVQVVRIGLVAFL